MLAAEAAHAHVPQVEPRERVARVGGDAETTERLRLVAGDAAAEERAVPKVPLRLGDAAVRSHAMASEADAMRDDMVAQGIRIDDREGAWLRLVEL